ncbi:MAG: serine/threonine protein kinase [Candidatus Nealsonbacteria bacterium]|nr:serine/threonine protein kinase [Candidatus Nealsonbacteria bacterium]
MPRRLGQWELVELAAKGGLARVYRARAADCRDDQPAGYALKVLRDQWETDPRAIAMLAREAEAGRSVSHPHLVSVLRARVSRPPRYLVMPWLDGSTLQSLLNSTAVLDLPTALWFARQTAEALDAMHRAGWMHGDVKPGNLLISPEGHVTLLDLGFARRPHEVGSAVDRCVLGTCNYMAPELITSALRPDIRSDVYSLGATLYETLAGRPPFIGQSLADLAGQHRQAIPPSLQRLAPHLRADVVRLVHRMLAKAPLRRPQTPAELIERLSRLEISTFSERA